MELQEALTRLTTRMGAIEQTKFTAREVADGMDKIAPIMNEVWKQTVGNNDLWQARIDGPVYRQTFILGQFRLYRQFRVWQLRRSLSV